MSKYTTEVRNICQAYAGLDTYETYAEIDDIIDTALPHIFDFSFPIFDENYRQTLEKKIILHFYTREIGYETVALWKLKLRTKLNEIMPYFNQLYESELMNIDPFYNVNLVTVLAEGTTGTTVGNDTTTDNSTLQHTGSNSRSDSENQWDKYSDTPQGSIRNMNGNPATIETSDDEYLTDARNIYSNGSSSGTDQYSNVNSGSRVSNNRLDSNGTRNQTITKTGYNGALSVSELVVKYRKSLLNIDMMIIDELEDLFLHLWN